MFDPQQNLNPCYFFELRQNFVDPSDLCQSLTHATHKPRTHTTHATQSI